MTAADLPFADSLRALAGWNQTLQDWRRLLEYEPAGCFVAEWNGTPAGTATTTCYGSELAWIGMVLVHPDYRRRGIGRALLARCLVELNQHDVPCIKLDATPTGSELYRQFGFQEEWPLTRWAGRRPNTKKGIESKTDRLQPLDDVVRVARLDAEAFGVSRQKLLERLAAGSRDAWMCVSANGEVTGYGLVRKGSAADYLGPLVATSEPMAAALVSNLIAKSGKEIYWDIPDANLQAVNLAKKIGFSPQRRLLRMFRGQNRTPGNPQKQFAIADPSVG